MHSRLANVRETLLKPRERVCNPRPVDDVHTQNTIRTTLRHKRTHLVEVYAIYVDRLRLILEPGDVQRPGEDHSYTLPEGRRMREHGGSSGARQLVVLMVQKCCVNLIMVSLRVGVYCSRCCLRLHNGERNYGRTLLYTLVCCTHPANDPMHFDVGDTYIKGAPTIISRKALGLRGCTLATSTERGRQRLAKRYAQRRNWRARVIL